MEERETAKEGRTSVSDDPGWVEKSRPYRLLFVVFLALLSAALVIASHYGVLHVCDSQLTFEGRAVRVCQPYAVADLIPVFVVMGLVLLPDLSEVTLPGGLALKVRLQHQEEETRRLQHDLAQIEQRLSVSTVQSQALNLGIAGAAERLAQETEDCKRRATEPGKAPAVDGAPTALEQWATDERRAKQVDAASQQLIGIWSKLQPWTVVGGDPDQSAELGRWLQTPPPQRSKLTLSARASSIAERLPPETLTSAEFTSIQRWATRYRDELNVVRLARNAVAHPPHRLDVEEIERAFDVGEDLLDLLEQGRAATKEENPPEGAEAATAAETAETWGGHGDSAGDGHPEGDGEAELTPKATTP